MVKRTTTNRAAPEWDLGMNPPGNGNTEGALYRTPAISISLSASTHEPSRASQLHALVYQANPGDLRLAAAGRSYCPSVHRPMAPLRFDARQAAAQNRFSLSLHLALPEPICLPSSPWFIRLCRSCAVPIASPGRKPELTVRTTRCACAVAPVTTMIGIPCAR